MATMPKIKSREMEMTSLGNHKTLPSKKLPANISFNMQLPVITNPIDPKRISKETTNCLNLSSVIKAGLVFFSTIGAYYLTKTTKLFSYFGWGAKNSKDVGNSGIMEVKNRANPLIVKTNLETTRRVVNNPLVSRALMANRDKDETVAFNEIKVKEFKNLPKVKEENVERRRSFDRRSIIVQNPIPNQNVPVGKFFELKIDGTYVFKSSGALFLEATHIPTWLISINLNPTLKGSYDMPDEAFGVALSGNYAYVAGSFSGLQIIDISDPSNPTFKGSYDMLGPAGGVVLSGNYAYVADGYAGGLQIIDISDPSNPTFKGSYDTPGDSYRVTLSRNYAYVADGHSGGLQIIDISDPAKPTFKGSYSYAFIYAYDVALSGNYAYVADYFSGLLIVDISNPANSTFKGSYDTFSYANGIAISGNYAYLANDYSGLLIIDISNPSKPTFKGSYQTPDDAHGVAIFGDCAYVTYHGYDYSGLLIIDISNPSKPTFRGSCYTLRANHVALSGNYAYVADGWTGDLQIVAPNLDKLILSGTPSSVGTYSVNIKACNEIMECAKDSFNITVSNK
jgi:hypothetical protein